MSKSEQTGRQIIEAMLNRRGVREVKYTSRSHIVLPEACSADTEDVFYELMQKYSFRIFLRDLITHRTHLQSEHLTRYCSQEVAQDYLDTLLEHGIVRKESEHRYTFQSDHVQDFGDTMEWFVAEVMRREFDSPSTWGSRLMETDVGGDYDILTSIERYLAYIEVKSSPPKHIDIPEVRNFVDRVQSLRPDFAIFLEDTHLRMKDKLAVMFEEDMQRRFGNDAGRLYPVRRLHDEIFCIKKIIFISNTKPELISNLRICLTHYLARGL